ncbi:3-hydroxyacyl-CoA dehydrogenase NAD-binding domain-containing protein [Pontibacter sp. HSC-36F09]|uniref:3-hydroxyacyl-CoA dehydrogenase NAD-binding domain-containing protein n=1 Tax=Pontibacter sp. HSC-36F09 TaxID=2910966 RepID=UPI00209EF5BE|nr:3-hydroxyacyl-CoA dehydrogenase NAD-binding domain-containing protein [Pontibacter sp. HSC-36F09]MCP2042714.1 3-hydroxybutyryl-CoA dehydrogenase [Pontibacter sp. HSC-36F09]
MNFEDIKTIGIVGAGTMGQGIAQICAQAGYKTILFDINAQVLKKAEATTVMNLDKGIERGKLTEAQKKAALANLTYTGDTLQLNCNVIIEAVVERLEVKQSIFKDLDAVNTPDTIFASNTSSIPITRIAAGIPHPERVVGMHFFNPAHIMKLVEVISGAATSPEVAETIRQLALKLDKKPVMAKDAPGFIVNRVARHFYVEGLKLLEEGVTDAKGIDRLMQASGFKMGPFELMDLIGVDTNFSVTSSMFEAFHYDPKFRPSRIQQQKVDAGHHGRKSGKGFYDYQ